VRRKQIAWSRVSNCLQEVREVTKHVNTDGIWADFQTLDLKKHTAKAMTTRLEYLETRNIQPKYLMYFPGITMKE
jgi:hypothetical protein